MNVVIFKLTRYYCQQLILVREKVSILNQACTCSWFLKMAFVHDIGTYECVCLCMRACMCVCTPPGLLDST